MHALVIDDSRAMRAILSRILTRSGLQVTEAVDGQDALEKLEAAESIGIALVDWNMPVMNGYDFIKAVRSEERYRDLWLVMVTTESEGQRVVKAMAAGANEYVMKPFTEDVILDKLRLLGVLPA